MLHAVPGLCKKSKLQTMLTNLVETEAAIEVFGIVEEPRDDSLAYKRVVRRITWVCDIDGDERVVVDLIGRSFVEAVQDAYCLLVIARRDIVAC